MPEVSFRFARFYLCAGVLAALMLLILFPLAFNATQAAAAAPAADAGSGIVDSGALEESGARGLASLAAGLVATGAACATVLLSGRLCAQLSLWMPDLDMQVS